MIKIISFKLRNWFGVGLMLLKKKSYAHQCRIKEINMSSDNKIITNFSMKNK